MTMLTESKALAKVGSPEPVTLSSKKTAVIVVDMQNDFVNPKGKIYGGEMVGPTIQKIADVLKLAREKGARIIYTQSWYEKDDPRFTSDRKARHPKGGCMAGSWGAQIIEELTPRGEPSIKKASYDPWFKTNLEELLKQTNFGVFDSSSMHVNRKMNDCSVIVTGTTTNVCVEKAIIGFFFRGYDIIVPIDCVSAISQYDQELGLYQFKTWYWAKLTRSDMLKMTA